MARLSLFLLLLICAFHIVAIADVDPKVTSFVTRYSTESVIAATITVAILMFTLLESFFASVRTALASSLLSRDLDRRVRRLKPGDKLILARFVEQNKMTAPLNPEDPAVAWLESLKLIFRSAEPTSSGAVHYRISLEAMDLFTKNPNLLR